MPAAMQGFLSFLISKFPKRSCAFGECISFADAAEAELPHSKEKIQKLNWNLLTL